MVIFCNDVGEIKAVGSTDIQGLTPIEVTDGTFDGWNDAKICCYKVNVVGGNVVMLTPYVDSRIVEHIDQLGNEIAEITPYMDSQRGYIGDTSVTFNNVKGKHVTVYAETDNGDIIPTKSVHNATSVYVTFEALTEVATITISSI